MTLDQSDPLRSSNLRAVGRYTLFSAPTMGDHDIPAGFPSSRFDYEQGQSGVYVHAGATAINVSNDHFNRESCAHVIRDAPLTANLTVTLTAQKVYPGRKIRVTRTPNATGGFTYTVVLPNGATKALGVGEWIEYEWTSETGAFLPTAGALMAA